MLQRMPWASGHVALDLSSEFGSYETICVEPQLLSRSRAMRQTDIELCAQPDRGDNYVISRTAGDFVVLNQSPLFAAG
jgi:hypothetical protein